MIASVTTGYNLYLLMKSLRITCFSEYKITKNMYNKLVLSEFFIGIDSMNHKGIQTSIPQNCIVIIASAI